MKKNNWFRSYHWVNTVKSMGLNNSIRGFGWAYKPGGGGGWEGGLYRGAYNLGELNAGLRCVILNIAQQRH